MNADEHADLSFCKHGLWPHELCNDCATVTDDAVIHPPSKCPYSGDWMAVLTNGKTKWWYCEGCRAKFIVK